MGRRRKVLAGGRAASSKHDKAPRTRVSADVSNCAYFHPGAGGLRWRAETDLAAAERGASVVRAASRTQRRRQGRTPLHLLWPCKYLIVGGLTLEATVRACWPPGLRAAVPRHSRLRSSPLGRPEASVAAASLRAEGCSLGMPMLFIPLHAMPGPDDRVCPTASTPPSVVRPAVFLERSVGRVVGQSRPVGSRSVTPRFSRPRLALPRHQRPLPDDPRLSPLRLLVTNTFPHPTTHLIP